MGLKKAVMIKKHEHYYWRKPEEGEEKYNKIYNVLWGSMSAGSQQLLKAEASFEEIEVEYNPHKLVELVIKQTHMCVDNYSQPVIHKDTLDKFYYGGEFMITPNPNQKDDIEQSNRRTSSTGKYSASNVRLQMG